MCTQKGCKHSIDDLSLNHKTHKTLSIDNIHLQFACTGNLVNLGCIGVGNVSDDPHVKTPQLFYERGLSSILWSHHTNVNLLLEVLTQLEQVARLLNAPQNVAFGRICGISCDLFLIKWIFLEDFLNVFSFKTKCCASNFAGLKLSAGPNVELHMCRTKFSELITCEVRRTTQLSSTVYIKSDFSRSFDSFCRK